MNEDGFRHPGIGRLADAGQEDSDGLTVAFTKAFEIKTIGELGAVGELFNVLPEICRILEWCDVVIEVSAGDVHRFCWRLGFGIDTVIKHSSRRIEFEQPKQFDSGCL